MAGNILGGVKMDSVDQMAMQVVLDALALRGTGSGDGPFRMVGVEPNHWPAERLRLAQRYGRMVPTSATEATAAVVAKAIAPHLRRELAEGSLDFNQYLVPCRIAVQAVRQNGPQTG